MSTYVLRTGSIIEYSEGVLPPDAVTEELANVAVEALNEISSRKDRLRVLELGIGSGAFSRHILDLAKVQVDLTGIDSDPKAIGTARRNLVGHARLHSLNLVVGNWHDEATFSSGPFDGIYFNPPYLKPDSRMLRPEFEQSSPEAVFSDNPHGEYKSMLPRIVNNLAIGGIAVIRYPGDGSVTFAGEDARIDHNPWMNDEEINRVLDRLIKRSAWLQKVMPADAREHMWSSGVDGRRVNAEIFSRIGDDISNAPKLIRDMDAYWNAYA